MIKQKDWIMIRNLYLQGMNKSEIARHMGIHRNTVKNNLEKEKTPVYERKMKQISKVDPYKKHIEQRLEKYNLTAEKLYREIKKQGYEGKYGILAGYVKELKKDLKTKAVLRFETLPGEQAQVDWGYFGMFYDKEQKRTIKLYCFFMILGYSRTLYIEFFERAEITAFLKGHNNAFEYFGGYTREILYDNLKSVVIKRALRAEDSIFNKKFMDFAGYYGFKPILCRPYKPNTKGKVENSVLYAKQNFFAGEKFVSLKDINEKAKLWLEEKNARIHGTTKQQPVERLKREGLNSIKNKRLYDINIVRYRRVFNDCHFSYGANHYSVPYKYAGKEVAVKEDDQQRIIVKYRDKVIAEHCLEKIDKGKYCTIDEHLKGLKEIRMSHSLPRPKKKALNKDNNAGVITMRLPVETLSYVEERSLMAYEEVM